MYGCVIVGGFSRIVETTTFVVCYRCVRLE
jgi:hypothetical protein